MEFLIAVLLVYGMTNIVVQGSIFDPFKDKLTEWAFYLPNGIRKFVLEWFLKLINCPMCSGFHIGWIVGIFLGPFVWWNVLFNGALYSGTSWIIYSIVQFFGNGDAPERNITVVINDPVQVKHINKEDND